MKRIQYFNWVRDIPFRLPLTAEEPDYCCGGKHRILEELLRNAGLEVRPRICENRWSDFKKLPSDILTIPHDDDALHVYLEVRIDGEWYQIDASLDKGLKRVLPVNEWDGKSSTPLCVEPLKVWSPKESLAEYNERGDCTEFLAENADFYRAVNGWFSSMRERD